MKKMYLIRLMMVLVTLTWFGSSFWFGENKITNAQVSDEEYQKRLERDKNVPQEKVDKAFAEAKKIQDDIIDLMKKDKPNFKLLNRRSSYSTPAGQRGRALDEIAWQNKNTNLHIVTHLTLNKEGISKKFWRGLNSISMGDFFKVSDIGDEAILVKNVSANLKDTGVGLHFIKGRAKVNVYLTNRKRKTKKNEKEIREIVKLIEPLIIARDSFDD